MDVLQLSRSSFLPNGVLIEGYTSLIWTERYRKPGEFELRTPLVDKTIRQLPLGSLISLRETREVMMVETHAVKKSNGVPELTMTGRSLASIIDNRHIEGAHGKKHRLYQIYTPEEAAMAVLWDAVILDGMESGVTYGENRGHNPSDAIPNACITDSSSYVDPEGRKHRFVMPGQSGDTMRKFLRKNRLGFRIIRPDAGSATVVTFNSQFLSSDPDHGKVTRTTKANIPELRFDIYRGEDRTAESDRANPVIFSTAAGDFEDVEYYFSVRDYVTHVVSAAPEIKSETPPAYVTGGSYIRHVYPEEADGGLNQPYITGLDRKVLYLDAGIHTDKEPAWRDQFWSDLIDEGFNALAEHPEQRLFNGKIIADPSKKYGKHYWLGDRVTLRGEYGFQRNMRVMEYIRTEDRSGSHGYPTMVIDD